MTHLPTPAVPRHTVRSTLVALALGAVVPAALAVPTEFRVDFTVTASQNCVRAFCFSGTTGGVFSGFFDVDSAALAADGIVNIGTNIDLALLHQFDGLANASQSHTASVQVSAGMPVALALTYNGNQFVQTTFPFNMSTSTSASFRAASGTWSRSNSTSTTGLTFSSSSSSASGTYAISAVPEPAIWLLWTVGLLALGVGGARRSRRQPSC